MRVARGNETSAHLCFVQYLFSFGNQFYGRTFRSAQLLSSEKSRDAALLNLDVNAQRMSKELELHSIYRGTRRAPQTNTKQSELVL